jgi:hypothetical protein
MGSTLGPNRGPRARVLLTHLNSFPFLELQLTTKFFLSSHAYICFTLNSATNVIHSNMYNSIIGAPLSHTNAKTNQIDINWTCQLTWTYIHFYEVTSSNSIPFIYQSFIHHIDQVDMSFNQFMMIISIVRFRAFNLLKISIRVFRWCFRWSKINKFPRSNICDDIYWGDGQRRHTWQGKKYIYYGFLIRSQSQTMKRPSKDGKLNGDLLLCGPSRRCGRGGKSRWMTRLEQVMIKNRIYQPFWTLFLAR